MESPVSALSRPFFDAVFLKRLLLIAIPIALQTMMFSSRSLVDILMVGQLSEADVAAIGIAGKAMFVSTLLIFGAMTGGSMLVAQYWGAGNMQGFREKIALTVTLTNATAALSALIFWLYADSIISVASDNPTVIALGKDYLQIAGLSLFCLASVSGLAAGLRAMHKPGISTFFSGVGISVNILLNWVFIFGHWGAPQMGSKGAAVATVLSGIVEMLALYLYLYQRQHLVAFSRAEWVSSLTLKAVKRFLALSLPTAFNFLMWSSGLFVYHAIIGHVNEAGLAAIAVITPVESLSLSFLIGTANAAAVLVGNNLGAKQTETAYQQAWQVGVFNFIAGVFIALVMLAIQPWVLGFFPALTGETAQITAYFYWAMCALIVVKTIPMAMIVGVLRAGGDVRYCLGQDFVAQWLIGIPVVLASAVVFEWPVYWVYALLATEELVKWVGSLIRVKSGVWLNNLVSDSN
ncbi:MATE family efflux transporter [Salinivibrio sp. PR919]|nr:MATE family efflux transporter [Salinivibrio sp. PR919]OOF17486.1 MATE family efflux transporter [Salinivibrio sp. PR932]